MSTPIRRLVKLNPVSAVLETRPAATGDYNPHAPDPDPDAPASPPWVDTLTPVVGAFSGVTQDGDGFDATFTIVAEDRPSDLAIENSRIYFKNADYGIARIRERFLRGDIDGYTLELAL